jgi:hypothetical protein
LIGESVLYFDWAVVFLIGGRNTKTKEGSILKKVYIRLIIIGMGLSLVLFGWNLPENIENGSKENAKSQQQRKIIIRDSVNSPLLPEAKGVKTMPTKKHPQDIPNYDVSSPIVITKMPYSEDALHQPPGKN